MRLLIVDDEKPARDKLRRLLAQDAGVREIAEAADGIEALEQIARWRPDAVFLDIAMPELSGIELAASLPEPAPPIVFVTAYDRHALQAFDAGAIDYLLKPFDAARLARAMARLRLRLAASRAGDGSVHLASGAVAAAAVAAAAVTGLAEKTAAAAFPALPLRQLLVTERGATRVVPVADIGWIESADNYVALHTPAGSPLLRQTLAGLTERLGPAFLRCHRRAAVQLGWIERVVPLDKGDCELVLRGGARVPCSRQYRAALMARLAAAAPGTGDPGP